MRLRAWFLVVMLSVVFESGCGPNSTQSNSSTSTASSTPPTAGAAAKPRWAPETESQASIIEDRLSSAVSIQTALAFNAKWGAIEPKITTGLSTICTDLPRTTSSINLDLWPGNYRFLTKLDDQCWLIMNVTKTLGTERRDVWKNLDDSTGQEIRLSLSQLPDASKAQLRDTIEARR